LTYHVLQVEVMEAGGGDGGMREVGEIGKRDARGRQE
jgi:hypothetical protein